jgi:hypothetical protein
MQKSYYRALDNKKISAKLIGDIETDLICSKIEQGKRIVGLTNGVFSLISLIHSVLKKIGKADVTLSTWSAGWYDSKVIEELIDSGLINDFKLIIDRSFKTRAAQYSMLVTEIFKPENIRTTNTHAKFVLIENDEWKILILSSMNLNENKRCENFEIDTDIDNFNLFKDFSDKLFEVQPKGLIESRAIVDKNFDELFEVETSNETFFQTEW